MLPTDAGAEGAGGVQVEEELVRDDSVRWDSGTEPCTQVETQLPTGTQYVHNSRSKLDAHFAHTLSCWNRFQELTLQINKKRVNINDNKNLKISVF